MNNHQPLGVSIRPRPVHDSHAQPAFLESSSLPPITRVAGQHPQSTDPTHTYIPPVHVARSPSANMSSSDNQRVSPTCDNLNSPEKVSPEEMRLHKFYHFLCSIPVMTLRRIAKDWGRKQYGLKKVLVARIYLFALGKVDVEQKPLDDVLKTCERMPDFNKYLADARTRVLWEPPPSKSDLLRIIGGAADEVDDDRIAASSEDDLTLSELARLMMLIRSDIAIKNAIYQSQLNESNADSHEAERFLFWETMAEPKFNNESYRPVFHCSDSALRDVDATEQPAAFRKGTVLMEQFNATRDAFLQYQERWLKGTADPSRFADMLPRNVRTGGMSHLAKRMLIVFHSLDCATASGSEDARLLGLAPKPGILPASGSGDTPIVQDLADGRDGSVHLNARRLVGISGNDANVIVDARCRDARKVSRADCGTADDEETDVGSEARSTGRPKRRRRAVRDEGDDNNQIARSLCHALKSSLNEWVRPIGNAYMREMEDKVHAELRLAKLQLQSHLINSMADARRIMLQHDDDPEFKAIAQVHYHDMKQEFFKLRHPPS